MSSSCRLRELRDFDLAVLLSISEPRKDAVLCTGKTPNDVVPRWCLSGTAVFILRLQPSCTGQQFGLLYVGQSAFGD